MRISRWRLRSSRAISDQAMAAAIDITTINKVASALIFGLTPRRTDENTFIGKVVEDGPDTKLAITRSSSDKVKASSQPDISAGAMIGKVTRRNASKSRNRCLNLSVKNGWIWRWN